MFSLPRGLRAQLRKEAEQLLLKTAAAYGAALEGYKDVLYHDTRDQLVAKGIRRGVRVVMRWSRVPHEEYVFEAVRKSTWHGGLDVIVFRVGSRGRVSKRETEFDELVLPCMHLKKE